MIFSVTGNMQRVVNSLGSVGPNGQLSNVLWGNLCHAIDLVANTRCAKLPGEKPINLITDRKSVV